MPNESLLVKFKYGQNINSTDTAVENGSLLYDTALNKLYLDLNGVRHYINPPTDIPPQVHGLLSLTAPDTNDNIRPIFQKLVLENGSYTPDPNQIFDCGDVQNAQSVWIFDGITFVHPSSGRIRPANSNMFYETYLVDLSSFLQPGDLFRFIWSTVPFSQLDENNATEWFGGAYPNVNQDNQHIQYTRLRNLDNWRTAMDSWKAAMGLDAVVVCENEAAYTAIENPDANTLYLIKEATTNAG